ncbi:hypothetical protein [Archaeal virus sp.]|nr:hypothetical protein [Archaeal virus sp.]
MAIHHPKFFVLAIILILLGAFIPIFPAKADYTYQELSISPNFEWSRHSWKIVYWNNRTFEAIFWCSSASSSQSSYMLYIYELNPQDLTLKSLYQTQSFTTTAIKLSATTNYPSIITTAISPYQNYLILWIYAYHYSDSGINKHFLALYTFDFTSNTTTAFSSNPIFTATDGTSYDITLNSPYHRLVIDAGNLEVMGFISYQSATASKMKIMRFYAVVTSLSPLGVTAVTNNPVDTGKTNFVPYEIAVFSSGLMRYVAILSTDYYGYYTFDTSSNQFSGLTLANKKMPNLLLESWSGSPNVYTWLPEYQFIPIGYNPSTNTMSYQLAGTYYIGFSGDTNKPYQSQYSVLQSLPTADTSIIDTYYLFTEYEYFIGYWDGYALKYHAWKRVSAPYNPAVIGFDTRNRQYQVVTWTPMVTFPAKAYITNVVEIQFLTSSSMRLYWSVQPRPTYTIPPVTTTLTSTTAYYTSTQALTTEDTQIAFINNVIIPLTIVSIPTLLLALYLGSAGLLVGLLLGGGILYYGGFAPFGMVFLIVLGVAVLLWRGGGGRSEEVKE